MLKELDLGDSARWKERFLASSIAWAAIASQEPRRGLVAANLDGILQLYAWDVETGELSKRTDAPAGVSQGMISAGGSHIYYHRDDQGGEIGHYVRILFDGGEEEDMAPYSSLTVAQSHTGNVVGCTCAGTDGFVERLQSTIRHEHWRIAFRRRYFTT